METNSKDAHILNLPVEILIKIFSYLTVPDLVKGVRPTSKYFHQLSLMVDAWKRIEIESDGRDRVFSTLVRKPDVYRGMLHQKCTRTLHYEGESEVEENKDILKRTRASTVEVRDVVRSVKEIGNVWSSCSVTGQMFYPSLKQLSLDTVYQPRLDFLARYSTLVDLHIKVEQYDANISQDNFVFDCFRSLTCLKQLQTLTFCLRAWYRLDPVTVDCMKGYFSSRPKLRQLCLGLCLGSDVVTVILDHCSDLQKLALHGADVRSESFQTAVDKANTLLSSLELTSCSGLDYKCLRAIAAAFPNMKTLGLTLNEKIRCLSTLLRATSLTCLKLTFCDYSDIDDFDDCLVHSVGAERALSWRAEKRSDACILHSGDILEEIACQEKQRDLQMLCLDSFYFFTNLRFEALCQNLCNLQVVILRDCDIFNEDIVAMAEQCPLLEKVHMKLAQPISSTAVFALMSKLPRLQDLLCNPCPGNFEDWERGQQSEQRTGSRADEVGSEAAKRPDQEGRDNRLNHLQLHSCKNLTIAGLSAVISFGRGLRSLYLSGEYLESLDDNFVKVILRSCAVLQILKVVEVSSYCQMGLSQSKVTDESLKNILRYGRQLHTVVLSCSLRITPEMLANVVVHSPCLSSFEITMFQAVSKFVRTWTNSNKECLNRNLLLQMSRLRDEKKVISYKTDSHYGCNCNVMDCYTSDEDEECMEESDDDDDVVSDCDNCKGTAGMNTVIKFSIRRSAAFHHSES